jgi:hypothetical protein
MKLRTIALLATALFALSALAVPAVSSATTLLDESSELNDKDIPMEGLHVIVTPKVGSISCMQRLTLTVKNQTVTISKYELFPDTCTFTGRFANCTISKYTPEGLEWKVDVDKAPNAALTIKDMTVSIEFAGKDCPYVSMKFTYEPMTGTPDNPKKITSFKFSGKPDVKLVPKESGYPDALAGTEIGGKQNAMTAFGQTVSCSGSTYDGELKEASSALTLTPTFNNSECKDVESGTTHKATIRANGCTFKVNVGEGSGDSWAGTMDLTCPAGKVFEVDVYFASGNENLKICTVKVSAQSGLKGLTITDNTEGGDMVFEGTLTGVKAEKSGVCGASSTTEAVFHVNLTIAGVGTGGGAEGVAVKGGLFTAEEAEVDAEDEGESEESVEEAGTYEIG